MLHWQLPPQTCVPPEPQLRVLFGAHTPGPLQSDHSLQTPLSQRRVCVPQLPQAREVGPSHVWLKHAPHPSVIRREAWLNNVWDSRAEGTATAMEEIILHAGYYDDNPRAREIVWIMLAQRCARGLASLYAQANLFDLQQAKAFQVEWTPRGWMRPDLDLLGFEQQLYMRQPG